MNEKNQRSLDMVVALQDLGKTEVVKSGSDRLVVKYVTGAVLEAQKVWMESQLDEWYKDLEKKFNVKIVKRWTKGGHQYSLVLKLEIPICVKWNISDDGFREELVRTVRKYFAERIIEEHPLPFRAKTILDIPIAPEAMCKYIFSKYQNNPVLDEKEAKIIEGDKFKQEVKRAIKENGGVFIAIRVALIRDGKYKIGYLEYKHMDIISADSWTLDPLIMSLHNVMEKWFKNRLHLLPHGETDIV